MNLSKVLLILNTVKYLKFKQIFFRIFYFLRGRYRKLIGFRYKLVKESKSVPLVLEDSIYSYESYIDDKFNFLNLSKSFDEKIDWNYNKYGKLWTYNLTYFEFLNQQTFKQNIGLELMHDFVDNSTIIKDGFEPFPISLRAVNWIKFLTNNKISDKKIDDSLYAQYYILIDNLEYQLLGNHLLENGFSLLFGAYYFQDEKLYQKAKIILKEELEEQILEDGGHFELSPMYHKIMLFRVLDCINLIENNNYKNQELLELLTSKAELMMGWLKNIVYKNGDIPLLNDSANYIAPVSKELFEYTNNLKLNIKNSKLSDSGYRKITKEKYECIVDIGGIGAKYIPGHAHADTFNFELRIDGKPLIVDSALSTYETNDRRSFERSTAAHNTVEVLGENSSEVWSGFKVANRAEIIELKEKENYIKATHNGYKKYDVLHTRSWKFEDEKIIIEDSLSKESKAIFRLHFHPNMDEYAIDQYVNTQNLEFKILNYQYAKGFNKLVNAKYMEIYFNQNCQVEIRL